MSLEEKIEVLTKGVCLLIEAVKANTETALSGDAPLEGKTKRKRRTNAELEADKTKKADISLDPVTKTESDGVSIKKEESDPLGILDTPEKKTEKITEDDLRIAAKELVNCDPDGEKGLAKAREIIKLAKFETLQSVTPDKYEELHSAFKKAVKEWKK